MTLKEREQTAAARAARMTIAISTVAERRSLGSELLNPELLYSASPSGWREALFLAEWWESRARLRETALRFHRGPFGTDPPAPFGVGERIVIKGRVAQTRRILTRLRVARASD